MTSLQTLDIKSNEVLSELYRVSSTLCLDGKNALPKFLHIRTAKKQELSIKKTQLFAMMMQRLFKSVITTKRNEVIN
jgi:hypothetical protein